MSRFDREINRYNTDSLKFDFAVKKGMPKDILPMWVADMDFMTPEAVVAAMVNKSEHGIFGYSESSQTYIRVLKEWFYKQFHWTIDEKWLVKTPGVVYGINTAIRAYTQEGDGVLIQEPVYYPFRDAIEINNRLVVVNELIYTADGYSIDFNDFEHKIVSGNVKLFILCSPHNPVGRVWTREELTRMGDLCHMHNVLVISDEIHADFVYEGNTHFVFPMLKKKYENISITCTAPSKTFNLAGLQISNIFIMNSDLRRRFQLEMHKSGYSQLNIMGIVACQAAYEHGEQWIEELKAYLQENLNFLTGFIKENLPKIKVVKPQGTYLVWLDFSGYGLEDEEIDKIMVQKAKVWLDTGMMFGESGKGFQRMNIACPRARLEKALLQMRAEFNGR